MHQTVECMFYVNGTMTLLHRMTWNKDLVLPLRVNCAPESRKDSKNCWDPLICVVLLKELEGEDENGEIEEVKDEDKDKNTDKSDEEVSQ